MRAQVATSRRPDWANWITWIAILAPIPYSLSRVLWAAGIPIGITAEFLRELDSPGWGSLGLLFLALLSEGTAIFTHVFVKAGARRIPTWIPFLRGRAVRPSMVILMLLMPITVLAAVCVDSLSEILNGELEQPTGFPGQPSWALWGHLIVFWAWGVSLGLATFTYWRRTRAWSSSASTAAA